MFKNEYIYKHQLREMLHCSRSTFTRYVKMHQPELTKMGVTPRTQKLPPNAVNYLCYYLCYVLDIDLPEKNHIKVKP